MPASISRSSHNVDCSLSVEPNTLNFPLTGGKADLTISNTGTLRLAIKLRCSNNALFRMNPVTCFLDGGKAQKVEITRLPGQPRTDKVLVQYCEAGPAVTDAKEKFKTLESTNQKIDHIRVILRVGDNSRENEQQKPVDKKSS